MENEVRRSCIDCTIGSCNLKDSPFPGFCTTTNMDEAVLADAMKEYEDPENRKVTIAAAEVEADNYMKAYNWMKRNPNYDLDVSEALAYTKVIANVGVSVEESGIAPNTFVEYRNLRSKCKGVDANNDGQADRNTVKNEVLEVIDNLPITSYQKDVLYFMNDWARSNLRKAPWH